MSHFDDPTPITAADVRALARLAGLPLEGDETHAEALAAALDADLRAIRRLRAVDAGEAHPLGGEASHGRR